MDEKDVVEGVLKSRLTLSGKLDGLAYTYCLAIVGVFPRALAEAFVVEVLEVRHLSFFLFFWSLSVCLS